MKGIVAQRPTETITGLGAALAVYGFCTQVGLPQLVAAIVAVVVLVVPYVVSEVVDVLRPPKPGVASDELLPPSARKRIEKGMAVLEGGQGEK